MFQLLLRRLVALAHIVAHVVVHVGAGQAVRVFARGAERHAVVGIGQRLQADGQVHAVRRAAADLGVQVASGQAQFECLLRGSGNAREVVQDDLVGRILAAECAIARPHHATALRGATADPQRFVGQKAAMKAGVVHHVASHLVGAVGDALGVFVVGRQ
ncbi:hypothetical protein SDC9_161892 [bioreactor metagenome]|uniref:Uncharacterized protein n=1 Tax=bioreactor metagenome TaxID=1076179 RepID=A0A645FJI7_9ZZZZ